MTDFEQWLATYLRSQDDDTLVVWSSKGLVEKARGELANRRETAEITLGDDAAHVANIGAEVTVDTDGLPAASCTCPARRVCKHRVVAALLLRERFATAEPEANDGTLPRVLETMTPEEARDLFGPRRWSKAKRAVADGLRIELSTTQGAHITLVGLGIRCSFLPQVGLEGSLCSCKKAFPCGHRALAVAGLLAQRDALDSEPMRERSSLDWDHGALLKACDAFVAQVATVGLEHTSHLWTRTATRLAVGAHTLGFADLERDLLRLATLLSSRHNLDVLACGTALATSALRVRRLHAEPRLENAGSFRRSYFDVGTVTLSCLGAMAWIAKGDLRGVRLLFFDGERILTHLVRIDSGDPMFSFGRRRHRGQRVWNAGRWNEMVGRRVHLRDARQTMDGRLSGTQNTQAAILEEFSPTELSWGAVRVDRWEDLVEPAQRRFDMDGFAQSSYRILAPAEIGEPGWDPRSRTVVVPLFDTSGAEVACRFPTGDTPQDPAHRMAAHAAHGFQHKAPSLILGEVFVEEGRLALQPAVFFYPGQGPAALELLWFSDVGGSPLATDELPRVPVRAASPPHLAERATDWLCSVLQGGLRKLTPYQREEQHRMKALAASAGLRTLAAHLGEATVGPGALFQAWVVNRVTSDLQRDAGLRIALRSNT